MSELNTSVRVLLSDERDLSRYLPSLKGMTVLLRADLNVPTREDRTVADENRITAVLPTITMLLRAGSKVAIASHFGRPSPNKQTWAQMTAASSLDSVARVLSQRLGKQFVGLAPDCIGPKAQACVAGLQPGQACLLENTRFHAGDVDNDPAFARALGQLADVYVLDAFGVMHRDQASVTGVIAHVAASFPGPLVRHELKFLMHYMEEPVRPLAVVVGGAKVADKIGVLGSLIPKSDVVLVGGRMAFTFLAAQGVSVGATQVEEDKLQDASAMLALAEARGVQLLLPCDVRVSRSLEGPEGLALSDLTRTCCSPDKPCLPEGAYGIDIGPASEAQFVEALKRCKTIFWNGPMGKFEVPEFASGTRAIAQALAEATAGGAITIVGGGDSAAAVNDLGLASSMSHISTGGGASLELVEGRALPGVTALAAASIYLPRVE
ncbi:phosphoglycerate kinase [Haematococcus lacustris]